jgi:hypothetical protein
MASETTPGHDEKRHRRDACATFFLRSCSWRETTPGHDEQRHRRDACATLSEED